MIRRFRFEIISILFSDYRIFLFIKIFKPSKISVYRNSWQFNYFKHQNRLNVSWISLLFNTYFEKFIRRFWSNLPDTFFKICVTVAIEWILDASLISCYVIVVPFMNNATSCFCFFDLLVGFSTFHIVTLWPKILF